MHAEIKDNPWRGSPGTVNKIVVKVLFRGRNFIKKWREFTKKIIKCLEFLNLSLDYFHQIHIAFRCHIFFRIQGKSLKKDRQDRDVTI